jgi:hypothetical protein
MQAMEALGAGAATPLLPQGLGQQGKEITEVLDKLEAHLTVVAVVAQAKQERRLLLVAMAVMGLPLQ